MVFECLVIVATVSATAHVLTFKHYTTVPTDHGWSLRDLESQNHHADPVSFKFGSHAHQEARERAGNIARQDPGTNGREPLPDQQ